MTQINYNAYAKRASEREAQNTQGPRVNYFSLKNDGDEAIVRIMHDSTDDFDIVAVHPTTIQGKRRNINCLRNPEDPIEKCPFCAAEQPLKMKMYIHMLQYVKNPDGTISVIPVLWDRSASYAGDIASKIEMYGPLSDNLFKIKRHGAAGSVDTTYSIDYAPPAIYNPEIYKKDTSLMSGVKALGIAVMNKNSEQMQELLNSGNSQATNVASNATQNYTSFINNDNSFKNNQANVGAYNTGSLDSGEVPRPRRYY